MASLGSKTIKSRVEPRPGTPVHVAIIMDGNGRWANRKFMPRTFGHREGAKRVDDIVTECCELGIRYLSLYTFSTENWNRPEKEVNILMKLLVSKLKTMEKKLIRNGVRLVAQGTLDKLPGEVQVELDRVKKSTHLTNPNLTLNLCLSYGGRQEIVDACARVAAEVKTGKLKISDIDENSFREHLYQPDIPDPDLLIRTGGDWRISNFLLWQSAYVEFWVTPVLWPEFTKKYLHEGLAAFVNRQRRFGKTGQQVTSLNSPEGLVTQ